MNNPIEVIRENNKTLKIEIPAMASWGSFDEIISFLIKEYNAIVFEKQEDPFWRKWILEINKQRITLIHDDMYGNELAAQTKDAETLLLRIGKNLAERLKGEILDINGEIQGSIKAGKDTTVLTFWNGSSDITEKIYKKLESRHYFQYLVPFGAPFSYRLIQTPSKYLDELLNDIKLMDHTDLKAPAFDVFKTTVFYVNSYEKEGNQYPGDECELTDVDLDFLQKVFNVDPNESDITIRNMRHWPDITPREASFLQPYVSFKFDFDKYEYRLECSRSSARY